MTASALWPSARGIGAGQEMPPFDEHVGGDRELEAGVGAQQRAIVADAEQRALRRPVEVAADELEFVQDVGCACARLLPAAARGELVEHAVDVLVAVGAAEALAELDRLVDHHLERRLGCVSSQAPM